MTPREVGNYRLDSRPGFGRVYKAYDTHRGRYVALKLLPEAFSGDLEYVKRFQRASHVAARLREPHVIPIHDFGEIDGQLFIDMRLVDGSDIRTLLHTNGRIAPRRAVNLISQVAQALDAAHADHLVHRDIKPSNILITVNDFVYVVDFGIAWPISGQQTSLTMGTRHYMAPERFAGHRVDGRADVYSLACVLHECLTGAPSFADNDLRALVYAQPYHGPPQASGLVEGVPPALDDVIARGMAKDPEERFTTAGALATAARTALLAEAPTPPPPMTELQAPTRTEMPAPTWQAATALAARQGVAKPPGSEAEPAGNRSAKGVPHSPTRTVLPDSVGDRGGMEYRGTGRSARARRSEPSWLSVIVTTLRLWLERHPVFGGRRPRGRRAAVALAVVIVVALGAGVTGVIIGRAAGSPSVPAVPAAAAGAFAAARGEAAGWVAGQVAASAIVACDRAMCAALRADGLPAARLLVLGTAAADPLGSDVVAATLAVRNQFGTRLQGVYAPVVIASFGTGAGRIDIRVIAPDGSAAYAAALAADRRSRIVAGGQLLRNPRIIAAAGARDALRAGDVDPRLVMMLAALAGRQQVRVTAFGDPSPGASPAVPLRGVDIAAPGPGAGAAAGLRSVLSLVDAQRQPFQPLRAALAGSSALRVEYAAPSPLGLLGGP
jgi:serine/threonine protein kinase